MYIRLQSNVCICNLCDCYMWLARDYVMGYVIVKSFHNFLQTWKIVVWFVIELSYNELLIHPIIYLHHTYNNFFYTFISAVQMGVGLLVFIMTLCRERASTCVEQTSYTSSDWLFVLHSGNESPRRIQHIGDSVINHTTGISCDTSIDFYVELSE